MGVILSVEVVTGSITASGDSTITTALTNSQDETNCVPFWSVQSSGDLTDVFSNRLAEVFFDNSGGPRVNFRRASTSGTQGTLSITCYVVEFDPAKVNVQQGTWSITATNLTSTSTITSVTQTSAFVVSNWTVTSATSDDFDDSNAATRFTSDTQLTHTRSGTATSLEGRYYVVECIGSEFSTQYLAPSIGATATSTTVSMTAVVLAKTLLYGQLVYDHGGDNQRDSTCRFDKQDTTTLRMRRDHGGTPAGAAADGEIWAVECANDEWDVQEFNVDVTASPPTNQTVTAIDQDLTAIIHQTSVGTSLSQRNQGGGGNNDDNMEELSFTSDTNVEIDRVSDSGEGMNVSFSTVEFELSVAGGRIMSSLVRDGGLSGRGGIAGQGGGLAG